MGTVSILQPAAGSTIAYYTPATVKWSTTNAAMSENGTVGYRVSLVSMSDGNEVFSGDIVTESEYQVVLQEADAPLGMYELRVTEASNRDVSAKITVKVAHASASIRALSPSINTIWTYDTPVTIVWEVTNVRGEVHVELYNGQTPVLSLANSSAGTFDLPKVPNLRSGFGYQIRLSGVDPTGQEIETFSPYFQLRGVDFVTPAGLCVINATEPRSARCKDPSGRPLLNFGAFALFELQFLWQTCVSLVGTTLDVSAKYTYYSTPDTDVKDNNNFLPMDNDRDLAVLDGKSSPHTLIVRLRNLVKGVKGTDSWNFTTDISITPLTNINATDVPIATGLRFLTTNPECKNLSISTAPTRCDPAQTKGCVPPQPEKQKLFDANKKVCSSFQVSALDRPCGENIVFTKTRTSETITTTTGLGEPCGGVFYVEVTNGRATGFVPSTTVGVCPPPKTPTSPGSSATRHGLALAALLFAVALAQLKAF
jgi:hypothetical protein